MKKEMMYAHVTGKDVIYVRPVDEVKENEHVSGVFATKACAVTTAKGYAKRHGYKYVTAAGLKKIN